MRFGSVCSVKNKAGRKAMDLTGQIFCRLTVLHRGEGRPQGGGKPRWVCKCECGKVVNIPAARLRMGTNKSCGCFRRDRMGELFKSHGKSKTRAYVMFYDARKRALKLQLPFDLDPENILIPETCPILGLIMDCRDRDHTPSLDRIIPSEGYTKKNVCVISFRANRFKSDASASEHELIAKYIRNGGAT